MSREKGDHKDQGAKLIKQNLNRFNFKLTVTCGERKTALNIFSSRTLVLFNMQGSFRIQ